MNRIRFAAVAALMFSSCAFAADAVKVEDLAKQLAEGTAPAKSAAEFEAAYAQVLPGLIAKPEADDIALQNIVFRAGRPGAEVERLALSKALLSKLADASVAQKVFLLRHIQRVAGEEAVPALSALLSEKEAVVAESARRALANIPTKAAADAIRAAFEKADDVKWKAALLNALAHRRDPADAAVFAKAAGSTDEAIRIPALTALARTGDATAGAVIAAARETGSDAAKAAANDAYLLLADQLLAKGNRADATKIYREYFTSPGRFRYAGIVGLGRAGAEEDVPKLLDLLGDKDPQARGAALAAISFRRDPATASEIVGRLGKADASSKPWLLRALIAQGDKRAAKFALEAAGDSDETVRIAAINVLSQIGDAAAVPLLLKSATGKGEEQVAARNALDILPGQDVDAALLQLIDKGQGTDRVEVIRALGTRRNASSVAPLFAAAGDADGSIRGEALKSLASVAEFDSIEKALGLLTAAKEDGDRENIGKTIVAIARKNEDAEARTAPLLALADKSEGPVRNVLLNALGQLGGDRALAAIRTAIKSSDEKTHEAGVRALTNWPDPAPLDDLLTLAKEDKSNTLSILSLRGYIRIVGLPSKRPAGESVKLFQAAMAVAKRPDEKKSVLGGLGELKDAKALEAVAPFISDPALSGEACAAAVKLARDTWDKNRELTKAAMTQVLETSKNDGQKKSAKEYLEKITPAGK